MVRRADRMRLSVTSRRPGGVGQPPARLRGTMENGPTGQMRSSNPPPACGAGCARVCGSRFGVWPHGKAHSAAPISRKGAFWLHALGGGAFPPVVFEHVTESSATVRAEWDDRLPAQVNRSQKSCGGEAGLNLKAKDPPEANAPSAVPVFLGAHGLRNRVHSVTGRNRSCPPASLWRTLNLSIEARKR